MPQDSYLNLSISFFQLPRSLSATKLIVHSTLKPEDLLFGPSTAPFSHHDVALGEFLRLEQLLVLVPEVVGIGMRPGLLPFSEDVRLPGLVPDSRWGLVWGIKIKANHRRRLAYF